MDHLRRSLAPVPDAAWEQIDAEAQRTLRLTLAARKVVDVTGPFGWTTDALGTGLVEPLTATRPVSVARRLPIPFLELAADFDLDLADVDSADRGNPAINTNPVIDACRRIAIAEDDFVFHGAPAGDVGIVGASTHATIDASGDPNNYPDHVAHALQVLRDAGINGPYALVVGDAAYTAIQRSTDYGVPIRDHIAQVLYGGEIHWSSALTGAVVLSTRGGDFQLALGEDLSLGYRGNADGKVSLYVEESLAFRVLTPEAAVHLTIL
jgi:uncharacterized linocin/CFP29 family protein